MPKYGNIRPASKRFGETLFCMVLTIIITLFVDVEYMLTPEYAERNIIFKIVFLIAS